MTLADFEDIQNRPRAVLLRWAGWFCAINTGLLAFVGSRYLAAYQWPAEPVAIVYVVTAFLGHFALLGFAPILLLAPLVMVWPRPGPVCAAAVGFGALLLAVVLVDSLLFAENRFHLTGLTVAILGAKTWAFGALYLLIFAALLALVAYLTWPRLARRGKRRHGVWLGLALGACVVVSQGLHAWADARYYVPVTSFTPYLPFYKPATAKGLMSDLGLVDMAETRARSRVAFSTANAGGRLRYPLAPLQCQSPASGPRNVMLILVDGMRVDNLGPELAPEMAAFARRSVTFQRHFSGGNSSRSGLFSLFYGLPPVYWQDFNALQRSSALIDTMQAQDYAFGIYSTAELYRPTNLDRTAFANIPDLRLMTPGEHTWRRDRKTVAEWGGWLEDLGGDRPFFSLLLLDSARQIDFPPDYPAVQTTGRNATAAERRRAEYERALHYVDGLVGEALERLAERDLMDETVVIVTSDHGQSFDDAGQGHVGYGSNFSPYQLQVPLAVHWPGREPERVGYRSAHFDIVPTLMRRVLGCGNPPSDYSSGGDLFDGEGWRWMIAGSYHNFAILEPGRVLVTYPGGYSELRTLDYELVEKGELDRDILAEAMKEMRRFYR